MTPEEVIEAFFMTFNDRTYADHAHHYVAADAVMSDDNSGQSMTGPEGAIAYNDMWANAFPDSTIEIVSNVADGSTVTTVFRGRGTFEGMMPAPDGSMIQGQGQTMDMEYTQVAEVVDGQIVSATTYYDMGDMMRQLGLG